MTTLTEFLEARLREDQEAAERMAAVFPEPWDLYDRGWMVRIQAHEPGWLDVVRLEQKQAPEGLDWLAGAIEHVAMHSPARVLREVAAKRRVLARHCTPAPDDYRAKYGGELGCVGCGDWESGSADIVWNVEYIENCPELRDLAAPYSDHEAYQAEWRIE